MRAGVHPAPLLHNMISDVTLVYDAKVVLGMLSRHECRDDIERNSQRVTEGKRAVASYCGLLGRGNGRELQSRLSSALS